MSEGKVINIKNPHEHEPHCAGWLACVSCGYVAIHVWSERHEPSELECGERGEVGHAEVWNRGGLLPLNLDRRKELGLGPIEEG